MKLIRIHPSDNVAVALTDIKKGETVDVDGIRVTAAEDIGRGHKIALTDISSGAAVVKYGNPIGNAKSDIRTGEWVHVHNTKTGLSETAEYSYNHKTFELPDVSDKTFEGYKRSDGRAGVRNEMKKENRKSYRI